MYISGWCTLWWRKRWVSAWVSMIPDSPIQVFRILRKQFCPTSTRSLARSLAPSLTLSRSAFRIRRWLGSYGLLMQQQKGGVAPAAEQNHGSMRWEGRARMWPYFAWIGGRGGGAKGRRPNDFLGLSFNDRTIIFLVILVDKTVSVG